MAARTPARAGCSSAMCASSVAWASIGARATAPSWRRRGRLLFAAFGPEPLDEGLHAAGLSSPAATPAGPLKTTLMDQSFMAGVGNIYADESLWRARLHPLRLGDVAQPRPGASPVRGRRRRPAARPSERRGSSMDDYTAPEATARCRRTSTSTSVLGRPAAAVGGPCRGCELTPRGTHFCSWCQRCRRPTAAGTNARLACGAAVRPAAAATGRSWADPTRPSGAH